MLGVRHAGPPWRIPCQTQQKRFKLKNPKGGPHHCSRGDADTVDVVRPGCQAAKLYTCCLHTLPSFSCHTAPKLQHTQTGGPTSGPIQTRIQTDPDPIHATTISDPDHNQLRVKTCDCLVCFLSSSCWFTIH